MRDCTPRERILTTLEHKEPDYIPYDLGSMSVTGISSVAYRNLVSYLGKGYLRKRKQEAWYYENCKG